MKIENNFDKIDKILQRLNSSDISLEESLAIFEEGVLLTNQCLDFLKTYKGKFEKIKEKITKIEE